MACGRGRWRGVAGSGSHHCRQWPGLPYTQCGGCQGNGFHDLEQKQTKKLVKPAFTLCCPLYRDPLSTIEGEGNKAHLRCGENMRCGLSGRVADCLRYFEGAGSRRCPPRQQGVCPRGGATPSPASYLLACGKTKPARENNTLISTQHSN